jgi:hypothetical protein
MAPCLSRPGRLDRKLRKDITVRKTHRSHASLLAVAALALTILAPIRGLAQESTSGLAPDAATWGEASGYDAVEANRAAATALLSASAPEFGEASGCDALEANRVAYSTLNNAPEFEAASGNDALDTNRVVIARQALATGDLGGVQEEALANLVTGAETAAMTWGDESGYNALETNRAAISGLVGGPGDDIVSMIPPHHNP